MLPAALPGCQQGCLLGRRRHCLSPSQPRAASCRPPDSAGLSAAASGGPRLLAAGRESVTSLPAASPSCTRAPRGTRCSCCPPAGAGTVPCLLAPVLLWGRRLHAAAAGLSLQGCIAAQLLHADVLRFHHAGCAAAECCAVLRVLARCQAHRTAEACRPAVCCCFAAAMALLAAACRELHAAVAAAGYAGHAAASVGGCAEALPTHSIRQAALRPCRQPGRPAGSAVQIVTLTPHGCWQWRRHCSDALAELAGRPWLSPLPPPPPLWLLLLQPLKAALAASRQLQEQTQACEHANTSLCKCLQECIQCCSPSHLAAEPCPGYASAAEPAASRIAHCCSLEAEILQLPDHADGSDLTCLMSGNTSKLAVASVPLQCQVDSGIAPCPKLACTQIA